MCGINAVGAQGCSCMSTFGHAPLKIVLLLHKMANGPYSLSETVLEYFSPRPLAVQARKTEYVLQKRLSENLLPVL